MKRVGTWLRVRWRWCTLVAAAAAGAVVFWMFRPAPAVAPIVTQAESAARAKDFAAARRLLDGALARNPRSQDLLLVRGQVAIAEGERKLAQDFLHRVNDQPAKTGARARFLEGALLLDLHRAREAESLLRRAVELDPFLPDPHFPLRQLYIVQLRRAELRSLLESLRRVRRWDIGDLSDYLIVGHSLSWEVPQSVERMTSCAIADPDDVESRTALAHYRSTLGEHDEAVRVAREIAQRFPTDPRGWALVADSLLSLSDRNAAAEVLGRIPAECPAHAWLWRTFGRLAEEHGDFANAVACFREAVRLDPEDERATYRLAVGLQQLDRHDEADEFFARARVLNQLVIQILQPRLAMDAGVGAVVESLVELGRKYTEIDRQYSAALCFEQAVQLDPANSRARELYARAVSAHNRALESNANRQPSDLRPVRTAVLDLARRGQPGSAAPAAREPPSQQFRFQNVAEQAGISFQYFAGETGKKYLIESMGGGVAVLDFDGDGWPDLHFTQGCRLPADSSDTSYTDRLFRNRRDGTFEDLTDHARLGDSGYSLGCSACDWDNDGLVDLFVANYGPSRMYRNNGDGTFSDVTDEVGVHVAKMSLSSALADFDRDGDLDLYVVNYLTKVQSFRNALGEVFTGNPQLFDGEQDVLFVNRGDGTFRDVTASSGVVVPNGKGLGVVAADLDGDQWPDIYVANDTTPNFLFHNRGAAGDKLSFQERGLVSGTALNGHGMAEAGMGIACADLDGNGLLDLHVTNFHGETNTLYLNRGNLLFVDATRDAGLATPTVSMLGFGTQALDVDRDGWLDLFVANGHIDQLPNVPWKMPPQLFRNLGKARFAEISAEAGDYFHAEYVGRGAALLDWNRDGRQDIVVVHQDQPAALLSNESNNSNHSVALELVGTASNRDAINASMRITAGGQTQFREIYGGDGFLASNERRQVIGLGAARQIDRLELHWPSGRRDTWTDLSVDCELTIVEGRAPRTTAESK